MDLTPLRPLPRGVRPVVLVLSGALSPVHRGHVAMLRAAAARYNAVEATRDGRSSPAVLRLPPCNNNTDEAGTRADGACGSGNVEQVVAGVLAPSADFYVKGKLGQEAFELHERNNLAWLAAEDERDEVAAFDAAHASDDADVAATTATAVAPTNNVNVAPSPPPLPILVEPFGIASGAKCAEALRAEFEKQSVWPPDVLASAKFVPVYGSDFLHRHPMVHRHGIVIVGRKDTDGTEEETMAFVKASIEKEEYARAHVAAARAAAEAKKNAATTAEQETCDGDPNDAAREETEVTEEASTPSAEAAPTKPTQRPAKAVVVAADEPPSSDGPSAAATPLSTPVAPHTNDATAASPASAAKTSERPKRTMKPSSSSTAKVVVDPSVPPKTAAEEAEEAQLLREIEEQEKLRRYEKALSVRMSPDFRFFPACDIPEISSTLVRSLLKPVLAADVRAARKERFTIAKQQAKKGSPAALNAIISRPTVRTQEAPDAAVPELRRILHPSVLGALAACNF